MSLFKLGREWEDGYDRKAKNVEKVEASMWQRIRALGNASRCDSVRAAQFQTEISIVLLYTSFTGDQNKALAAL